MSPVDWLFVVFAAALGGCIGSFLNVCIWRLPRPGLSIFSPPRSHCPGCGEAILWYDNVPIIGWMVLGARCRGCKSPVSSRYPLVEALTSILFAIIAMRFLPGSGHWPEFLAVSALTAALIVVSFVDIDLRIIPDEITLPGMMALPFLGLLIPELHTPSAGKAVGSICNWIEAVLSRFRPPLQNLLGEGGAADAAVISIASLAGAASGHILYRLYRGRAHPQLTNRFRDGLLAAIIGGTLGGLAAGAWLHPEWAQHPRFIGCLSTLLGMAAGAGLILLVGILGKWIFRKEAMGFGDVKLMGLLGGFVGWSGVLAGFAIACFLGSVVGLWRLWRYKTRYLWFGPFLSAGCLAVLLFPETFRGILDWYLGLFR